MKLICTVVRPEKVDSIKAALNTVNVVAITVAGVHDCAPQRHETTVWRGHEYSLGCSAKMQITFAVHDEDVDAVVNLIICKGRTGEAGDGHVSVLPVEHRYNICDGLRDVS